MNRKERRAAQKKTAGAREARPPQAAPSPPSAERGRPDRRAKAEALFRQSRDLRASDAQAPHRTVELLRRALALAPDFAEAHNELGGLLLAQGRREEAATHLERALALTPELYEAYGAVLATFYALFPAIGEAVGRAAEAWPRRLDAQALFGPAGLGMIADNAFLCRLLESHTVCDIAFERFSSGLRPLLAAAANEGGDGKALRLACALATQSFLNEYVFATTPGEAEWAEQATRAVAADIAAGRSIAPTRLAVLASFAPLGALPGADRLAERDWPASVARVIAQQVTEPRIEREIASGMPRLTPITDATSQAVRQQYEENPYPRWSEPASQPPREPLRAYLRRTFPAAAISPREGDCDMLVAGCGTGRHPVEIARKFSDVRILAVDLSLASLAYAQRKSRELGLAIGYAQADILELGSLDRRFDAIDAGGVLHHLADPFAGWRVLWSLLRAGGVMRVALYSALARRDIAAARRFVAERGLAPTPDGIRRARDELLATPLRTVAWRHDFFSVSECRDLLFHVQEHGLALPAIKQFLASIGARLIGFELPPGTQNIYRARCPADPTMVDLDRWHAFEQKQPDTFAAMYQFWIAKD